MRISLGPWKQAPNPNGRRSRQTSPISDQHCGKTVTDKRIQSVIYGRKTKRTPLGNFEVSTHSFRNAVAKTATTNCCVLCRNGILHHGVTTVSRQIRRPFAPASINSCRKKTWSNLWRLHVLRFSVCCIMDYGIAQSCGWIPTFRSNMLSPFSGLKRDHNLKVKEYQKIL